MISHVHKAVTQFLIVNNNNNHKNDDNNNNHKMMMMNIIIIIIIRAVNVGALGLVKREWTRI